MIVVFDLDGTLANCEHRMHHIKPLELESGVKPKKNWKAFFDEMVHDEPIEPIIHILFRHLLADDLVFFCTGRPETHREQTLKWINDHIQTPDGSTFGDEFLYMRGVKDNRKDYVTKAELADQIITEHGPIDLWFDDRREVVKALRAKGIKVLAVDDND